MKDIINKTDYEPQHRNRSLLVGIVGIGIVAVSAMIDCQNIKQATQEPVSVHKTAREENQELYAEMLSDPEISEKVGLQFLERISVGDRSKRTVYIFQGYESNHEFYKCSCVRDSLRVGEFYDVLFSDTSKKTEEANSIDGLLLFYKK